MSDGTGIAAARPDLLDRFADDVGRLASQVGDAALRTHQAAVAYQRACPDGSPIGSPAAATEAADGVRAVALGTQRIGRAFREADRSDGRWGIAFSRDLPLTRLIAAQYPGLVDHALLAPIRELAADGRATGREVAHLLDEYRVDEASIRLQAIDADVAADPTYAAALLNELTSGHLLLLTDALIGPAAGGDGADPEPVGPDTERLVLLIRQAARGWDHPAPGDPLAPLGPALDRDLVEQLGDDGNGRNLLRLVVLVSSGRLGHALLADIARITLLEHAPAGDVSGSTASRLLGDGEAPATPVLHALRLHVDVAVELLTGAGVDREATMRTLVEHAGTGPDQDALAALVGELLAHPDLGRVQHGTTRAELIGPLVTAVGEQPSAVRPPMAGVLLDTLEHDLGAWATLAERTTPGGSATSSPADGALHALALHEEQLVTLLAILDAHERELLVAGVRPDADSRGVGVDLERFDAIVAATARGARAADAPDDPWGWVFAAGRLGVSAVTGKLPGGPIVKLAARPLANAALGWGHDALRTDPGTNATDVREHQLGRRRNAWLAVAADPDLGGRVRWDVPGSPIRSADDLALLGTEPGALHRLDTWAEAQDGDLRTLVDHLEPDDD